MKTIKTSELSGVALDWAVAKCEGIKVVAVKGGRATFSDPTDDGALNDVPINYSTDWSQGGPILEREGISINAHLDGYEWFARDYWGMSEHAAEKPLEAAMRCYVASKLGDTVEVPEELLK